MQPYFCQPAVSLAQVAPALVNQYGDIRMYPMCATLSMGFSHSVYIAQRIHDQCLYAASALQPQHNILQLQSPYITTPIHLLYIDDNCILGTRLDEVTQQYESWLAPYRTVGLLTKPEKCVPPTAAPTEILGILIDGHAATMSVSPPKLFKLLGQTLQLLRGGRCSGATLARLMGHRTWLVMLRRPVFATLRYSYIFIQQMQGRTHNLWPSVVNELYTVIAPAPLMHVDMTSTILDMVPATDASLSGNGMVLAHTTPDVIAALYPLAVYNPKHHVTETNANGLLRPTVVQQHLIHDMNFATIISHTWRYASPHINELELQSVLSMLRHSVTRPATLHSTILHLVDNTPSFSYLRKGRSSSVRLLPVLKKIATHLLAHDMTLLSVWVPTEINPADTASRLCSHAILS